MTPDKAKRLYAQAQQQVQSQAVVPVYMGTSADAAKRAALAGGGIPAEFKTGGQSPAMHTATLGGKERYVTESSLNNTAGLPRPQNTFDVIAPNQLIGKAAPPPSFNA